MMKTALLLIAALLPTAASAATPARVIEADAPAISVERFGLYVVSDDLERSRAFYEALFETPPQIVMDALVGFDVNGSFYAIVSRNTYAPDATIGGNVMPYIRVADIGRSFNHVQAMEAASIESESVVSEGPFSFFRFADPDGNMIEFFSLATD